MSNAEVGQPHTAHTSNPVPLIYIGRPAVLAENGALSDIAPTMLQLMGLEKPEEMGGDSLVSLASDAEQPPIRVVPKSSGSRKMG
jgi:2,3-bisphosphoglycerate-independent phosphoglycerate mutase